MKLQVVWYEILVECNLSLWLGCFDIVAWKSYQLYKLEGLMHSSRGLWF